MRPCIACGEPSPQSRCPAHRTKDARRRTGQGEAAYDPVWRALSRRARRDSPYCVDCGAVNDLTSDHLIPKSIAPELVHAIENIAVRCRPCNSRRSTKFATADAHAVLDRLRASHQRHPTRAARDRIAAAERALTLGTNPQPGYIMPRREANFGLHTAGAVRGEAAKVDAGAANQ